jgi:hypothetical protein
MNKGNFHVCKHKLLSSTLSLRVDLLLASTVCHGIWMSQVCVEDRHDAFQRTNALVPNHPAARSDLKSFKQEPASLLAPPFSWDYWTLLVLMLVLDRYLFTLHAV